MKSLFVCSERNINNHIGEEYDNIFEVPTQPTTDNIQDYSNEIRIRIAELWKQDVKDETREGEPVVQVHLDAASPFNAMLIDFQIVMNEADGIKIELPYLDSTVRTTQDSETQEVIRKLDERSLEREGEKNA